MRSTRPTALTASVFSLIVAAGTAAAEPALDLDQHLPSLQTFEVPAVNDQDFELDLPRVLIEPRVVSTDAHGAQRVYVARLDNVKFPERDAVAAGTAEPEPALDPSEDLSARVAELQAQLAKYRAASNSTEKRMAIFSMLAALTWILLAGFKRLSDMSTTAKRWLPRAALFAGVAAGLFAKLGMGEPWLVAVLYGAGPGLAVLIQELIKGWVKPKDPA